MCLFNSRIQNNVHVDALDIFDLRAGNKKIQPHVFKLRYLFFYFFTLISTRFAVVTLFKDPTLYTSPDPCFISQPATHT